MAKQYKALKPVGRWQPGDIIGDLPKAQIEKLLLDGLIQAIPDTVKVMAKKEVAK